jgi:hypothetical protein
MQTHTLCLRRRTMGRGRADANDSASVLNSYFLFFLFSTVLRLTEPWF